MTIHRPEPTQFRVAASATVVVQHRRGVVEVTGADRLDLLHRLSTNSVSDLLPEQERTTVLTTAKGRIVDLLRVLVREGSLLLVSAWNDARRTIDWIEKYTIMDDVLCADATDAWRLLGVYGESARVVVEEVLSLAAPDSGEIRFSSRGQSPSMLLRDRRLNGGSGFLLVIDAAEYDQTYRSLIAHGAVEIGEPCYEALRVAAGLPAADREITDLYNPLEVGIAHYVSWTKGCYVGQEVIARLDAYDKIQRHLMGIRLSAALESVGDEAPPEVFAEGEGASIGTLTSVVVLSDPGETIALACIKTAYAVPGLAVSVGGIRGKVEGLPLPT